MERYECQDVQAVLSGILDGELDAPVAHLAEAHLAQCAPCRAVLQQAEETDDLLRATIGGYEVWPADLDQRIRTQLFGESDTLQIGRRRRRLLLAAWTGWSVAAVVMLGFGLTLSQGWLNPPRPTGDPVVISDQPPAVESVAPKTWLPPVGSEVVNLSIFDDDLSSNEPAIEAVAVNDPVQPEAVVTSNSTPTDTVDQPVGPERSEPTGFSPRALAGVEAEVGAGQWLRLFAANLVERSMSSASPAPVEPEVAPPTVLAVAEEPADMNTAEVLHQASILLTVLEQAGEGSFSDVRMVQQALSSDDVLERLAVARADLPADSVDLVNRAWSMLEWTTGSVDQAELERVKQSIAMQDLPRRLERLSDQYWN